MKPNYTHIGFILDESASMHEQRFNVVDWVNRVIEEHKDSGNDCTVSIFKFSRELNQVVGMLDVHSVKPLYTFPGHKWKVVRQIANFMNKRFSVYDPNRYNPVDNVCYADDGICHAIIEIGKYLANMEEKLRPSTVKIYMVTKWNDTGSKTFNREQCKQIIEHQSKVYSWQFEINPVQVFSSGACE